MSFERKVRAMIASEVQRQLANILPKLLRSMKVNQRPSSAVLSGLDNQDIPRAKVTAFGDDFDNIAMPQIYGLASRPAKGAQGLLVPSASGILYFLHVDDRRKRPTIEDGETALWCNAGQVIHLKGDGSMVLGPLEDPDSQYAARKGDKVRVVIDSQTVVTSPGGPTVTGTKNANPIVLEGTIIEGSTKVLIKGPKG